MKKPELLSPVFDFVSLSAALDARCDAVYFGLKELNMRITAKNFELGQLAKVVKRCHDRNVKAYLALNTIVYDDEILRMKDIINEAKKADVDAIICWDPAVIEEVRKAKIPLHISTQASVSNAGSAKFYKKLGAKRVILARELSLEQISEIKKKAGMEVECFIHGAMCVSISGRCFMSQSVFGRSANRGDCLQPCRREYNVKCNIKSSNSIANEIFSSKTPPQWRLDGQIPAEFVLRTTPDGASPGSSSATVACGEAGVGPSGLPSRAKPKALTVAPPRVAQSTTNPSLILENCIIKDVEEGYELELGKDYVMSPKDLCTLPFIEKLIEAGIDSFKIEGRARSPEYVKTVTEAYREAIDAHFEKRLTQQLKARLMKKLETVYNRGFSSGFFLGKPIDEWTKPDTQATEKKIFVGIVRNYYSKPCVAEIKLQSGGIKVGDKMMFQGPTTGVFEQKITSIEIGHRPVKGAAKGSSAGIKVNKHVRKNDKVFLIASSK